MPQVYSKLNAASFTSFSRKGAAAAAAVAEPGDISVGPEDGPVTRFEDLGRRRLVCKTVVDTITKDMGLETMTEVQAKTINATLTGADVYVHPGQVYRISSC